MSERPPISSPSARATSPGAGAPPKNGFATLVPELAVTDIEVSLAFWCGPLGFRVAYDRPLARFAYLERGSAQIMLCEMNGRWETGEAARPFGRGINLQIEVDRLDPLLHALETAGCPLFEAPAVAWYRAGDVEIGQREFLVQDPDGYLLRFIEGLGTRSAGGERTGPV